MSTPTRSAHTRTTTLPFSPFTSPAPATRRRPLSPAAASPEQRVAAVVARALRLTPGTADKAVKARRGLPNGKVKVVNRRVLVVDKHIVARGGCIGEGVESDVHEALILSPEGSVSRGVVKQRKFMSRTDRYAGHRERLQALTSPRRRPHIDLPIATGVAGPISYSVNHAAEGSLDKLRFADLPNPVDYLLKLFAQVEGALDSIHRHGGVQGDVKPANILFDFVGAEGALTDFGTLRDVSPEVQRSYTCGYADPQAFVGQTLQAQRERSFVSSAASDCFAFGMTIERTIQCLIRERIPEAKLSFIEKKIPGTDWSEALEQEHAGRFLFMLPRNEVVIPKAAQTRYDAAKAYIETKAFSAEEQRALKALLHYGLFSLHEGRTMDTAVISAIAKPTHPHTNPGAGASASAHVDQSAAAAAAGAPLTGQATEPTEPTQPAQ